MYSLIDVASCINASSFMVSSCCLSRFQNSKMCFRRRHTSRRSQRCICQTNRYKAKLAFTTVYNNDPMCWCFRISVLYVLRCCVDVSCSLSVMSVTKLQTVIVWICFVLKWALRISVYDALSMLYFQGSNAIALWMPFCFKQYELYCCYTFEYYTWRPTS